MLFCVLFSSQINLIVSVLLTALFFFVDKLEFKYSRSGGGGGQHVNKGK